MNDLRLQFGPAPQIGGGYAPKVVLKLSLARRATRISLVVSLFGRKFGRRLESGVVDGLEDLQVQLTCLDRVEWQPQRHERVREALHTDANRTVAHVRVPGLRNRVVVRIDDAVQVERDDLCDVVEPLEVVLATLDEGWKGDGSQVANSRLVRSGVFDDLRAEVRGLDSTEVLLVRFPCDDC